MWVTEEVSLVEFYQSCLGLACEAGYNVILSFIARKADAPQVYDEILEAWHSLDDLTGPRILFLFAGNSVHQRLKSESICRKSGSGHNQERLIFSPDIALFLSKKINNKKSRSTSNYSVTSHYTLEYLRSHTEGHHPLTRKKNTQEDCGFAYRQPERPRHLDIERSQTSQIREIRDYLSLCESDIPCIHLTFLDGRKPFHYKVRPDDNIYQILKIIVDMVESKDLKTLTVKSLNIAQDLVSVKAELAKLQTPQKKEEVFVSVITTLRDNALNGSDSSDRVVALEKSLIDLIQEPNEQHRRAAFDAFKGAREILCDRPFWHDLKSGVQRVIDLAAIRGPVGDISDVIEVHRRFSEQKADKISLLEEQKLDLEARSAAVLREITVFLSAQSIRQRVKEALSSHMERSLDTFIVIAARQEMEAVRSYLDSIKASRATMNLSSTWRAERVLLQSDRHLEFGLIQAPAQGVEDMASLLDFLQSKVRPASVLMVGMMAGIPDKSQLLDVQAPRNIINGTRIGTRDGMVVAEPHGRDVDPVMHNRLQSIDRHRSGIADITLVTHKHSICVAAKFDDLTPDLAQAALSTDPENIVGIEMEGSALTARQTSQRRNGENTGYLMIKGVADYADEKASAKEIAELQRALEASGITDVGDLLKDPDPTTNKRLKSALQKVATINALRVALALIEEEQN
ncbi:hypothetical protein PY793_12450 [Acetobacter fabarum]|uniref:hypothetical protein n=1 Tax=Acetobacter fabarum TaxID=483199 RepID=UPI00312BBCAC